MSTFLRFAAVGTLGFLVDATLLSSLVKGAEVPIYVARGLSFLAATVVTWQLNRSYSFRRNDASAWAGHRRYGRYLLVQSAGAGINFFIFAVSLHIAPELATIPAIPAGFGSVMAMFFNYAGMKLFVFSPPYQRFVSTN